MHFGAAWRPAATAREVARAVDRGEAWLYEHLPAVRRPSADAIYNNWTHAYSLQALALLLNRHAGDQDRCRKIRDLMAQQVDLLGATSASTAAGAITTSTPTPQQPSGSTMSFVTAAVLVALRPAKDSGVDVPQRLVDRAKASILRQRKPDFSYDYGEYLKYRPMRPVNRPGGQPGPLAGLQPGHAALGRHEGDRPGLKTWLDRLFARNLWLDLGRKTADPARIVVPGGRLFLLFRPLLCGACASSNCRAAERPPYRDQLAHVLHAGAGQGRLVVGFPAVRLPSAIRHGLCVDVAGPLPAAVILRGFRKKAAASTRLATPSDTTTILCQV